jgi:hypothetical protein
MGRLVAYAPVSCLRQGVGQRPPDYTTRRRAGLTPIAQGKKWCTLRNFYLSDFCPATVERERPRMRDGVLNSKNAGLLRLRRAFDDV